MKRTIGTVVCLAAVFSLAGLGCSGEQASPSSCVDGKWNGDETDLDCGGPCGTCAAGGACADNADCESLNCVALKCAAPACDDGLLNGYETDLDCGANCAACQVGERCRVGSNCSTGSCLQGFCAEPTCDDRVNNGDEQGVDCGGSCGPCEEGQPCLEAQGCTSGVCGGGLCQPPACDDGVQNGSESDGDCGGPVCAACPAPGACLVDGDCDSRVCLDLICQVPTCFDGVHNGDELGLDCAGSCDPCLGGQPCVLDLDCISRLCNEHVCEASTCADLVLNGDETDVDCGGSCPACTFSQVCTDFSDCQSGICDSGQLCAYGASCAHILSTSPQAPDGRYLIDPELDGYLPLWAQCDMNTDRGGWTLVLNYLHRGGTNPQLYNSPDKLPWLVSSELGRDEQGTFSWRHAQNQLFAKLAVDEIRFEGITSAHNRQIHFKTDLPTCIAYFASGMGSCAGIQHRYAELPGHTSLLPDVATGFTADMANQAMTDFPFYSDDWQGEIIAWAIRGEEAHWAMDHGRTLSTLNTLHRAWVRAAPMHCADGTLNHSETDLDCGGLCAGCADGGTCGSDADCQGTCLAGLCTTLPNCTEIKANSEASMDGIYRIDPDGAGPLAPMQAYCDMSTDGGGWTLVANYLHQAQTDPALQVLDDRLPLRQSDRLGKDESGTQAWGHAGNALVASLDADEVRFVGRSSNHQRVIDFKSDVVKCAAYLAGDPNGNCESVAVRYQSLPDHSANLPDSMTDAASLAGDNASIFLPFFEANAAGFLAGHGNWLVDDWNAGTSGHTLHRVFVRSVRPHCYDGQTNDGELDEDCGGTCPALCDPAQSCQAHSDCSTGFCEQGTCALQTDCSQIRWADPAAPSGDYLVDLDGDGGLEAQLVSCDMTTSAGGWTLVMNYLHQADTDPALHALSDRLPLRGAEALGVDESGTASWGHATPALLAQMDIGELRFDGRSSGHARRIHFATSSLICLAYAISGQGGCGDIAQNHRLLAGHSAYLPRETDNSSFDQGDQALTLMPFWTGHAFHWMLGSGGRWEVDDYQGNDDQDTLHRVWVRATPDHCSNNQADLEEEGIDCGGLCAIACSPLAAGEACSAHVQCSTGACMADVCSTQAHCTAILAVNASAASGDYLIDPDGDGGLDPFFASCEMVTDGGGWTLVLNYLHQGATNPALASQMQALPLRGSNILGSDESGSAHWGHAHPDLIAQLAPTQVRFAGNTSGHSRRLHFSSQLGGLVDYFSTGLGSAAGIQHDHTLLPGHTGILPAVAEFFWTDQAELAMTAFPFYGPHGGGNIHWGIGQLSRWEVDDAPGGDQNDTLHRVWVRTSGQLMAEDFEDGDLDGWSVWDTDNPEQNSPANSNWHVENGWATEDSNIISRGCDCPDNCLYLEGTRLIWNDGNASNWRDYSVSVDLRSADNDMFGLVFYYQDQNNFYQLITSVEGDCAGTKLIKRIDGHSTYLASEVSAYTSGTPFQLEVGLNAGRIVVYRDGNLLFGGPVQDSELGSGTIGLSVIAQTPAEFDNVRVFAARP